MLELHVLSTPADNYFIPFSISLKHENLENDKDLVAKFKKKFSTENFNLAQEIWKHKKDFKRILQFGDFDQAL